MINMGYVSYLGKTVSLRNGLQYNIPRTNIGKCKDIYFEYYKKRC